MYFGCLYHNYAIMLIYGNVITLEKNCFPQLILEGDQL